MILFMKIKKIKKKLILFYLINIIEGKIIEVKN